MERKMYEPTEKQNSKWGNAGRDLSAGMPSDDEFKAMWKKAHGGKIAGWGLKKRDWITSNLACTREYEMGLWQARVDRLNGLDYQAPLSDDDGTNINAYNLGYYRGYTEFPKLAREMGGAFAAFCNKYYAGN